MSQHEQQDVIADYADGIKQLEMQGHETAIRKARNALFWAGGLVFLGEMIGMGRMGGFDLFIFLFALAEAGIFIGLAFWTKTKPFTAVVTGLVAFILLILVSAILTGMEDGTAGVMKSLFGGIIVKVLILVNLIMPLKNAKAWQDAKNDERS